LNPFEVEALFFPLDSGLIVIKF